MFGFQAVTHLGMVWTLAIGSYKGIFILDWHFCFFQAAWGGLITHLNVTSIILGTISCKGEMN